MIKHLLFITGVVGGWPCEKVSSQILKYLIGAIMIISVSEEENHDQKFVVKKLVTLSL